MNKKSKALWFIFGFVIGGMVFVTPTKPGQTKTVAPMPTKAVGIQDVFYKEYMRSCGNDTVVNAEMCDCMYKHVLNEMGFEKMYALAQDIASGKTVDTPPEYMRAAIVCAK